MKLDTIIIIVMEKNTRIRIPVMGVGFFSLIHGKKKKKQFVLSLIVLD